MCICDPNAGPGNKILAPLVIYSSLNSLWGMTYGQTYPVPPTLTPKSSRSQSCAPASTIRQYVYTQAYSGWSCLHIWWWVLFCINLVRACISVALSMSNVQTSKVTQYVCACSGCDHRCYWTFFPANFNLASLNESGQRGTPRCFAISYGIWDLSLNILSQFMPRMPRRILILAHDPFISLDT